MSKLLNCKRKSKDLGLLSSILAETEVTTKDACSFGMSSFDIGWFYYLFLFFKLSVPNYKTYVQDPYQRFIWLF
jgi:hypothetical protein